MKNIAAIFGIIGIAYASPSQESITSMLPMLIAFAGITYFMLVRPQQKQQQKLEKLIAGLKPQDRIKLSSGIIGTITQVDSKNITLEIAKEVTILVDKLSVLEVIPNNK